MAFFPFFAPEDGNTDETELADEYGLNNQGTDANLELLNLFNSSTRWPLAGKTALPVNRSTR